MKTYLSLRLLAPFVLALSFPCFSAFAGPCDSQAASQATGLANTANPGSTCSEATIVSDQLSIHKGTAYNDSSATTSIGEKYWKAYNYLVSVECDSPNHHRASIEVQLNLDEACGAF